MSKGTALVKSRERYKKLMGVFPDRAVFYNDELRKVEEEIDRLNVCRRCGRPLANAEAKYGKECLAKAMAEMEEGIE